MSNSTNNIAQERLAKLLPNRKTILIQLGIKLVADKIVSLLSLLLLSPLFLVIVLLIKLDDGGPIYFRQQRLGKNGEPFSIWKFRSMIMDADRYLDESGSPTRDRITRVGRVLRRLSLDELPQLINILTGEMSLVGPRPVLPAHLERYTEQQKGRFAMRPGLTGLAQISGRNELKWSRRLELDNQYIKDFSLWLDIVIVLRTVWILLTSTVSSMDRNPGDVDDLPPPRNQVRKR